jgi:protein tyrosine kinase modulator
MREQISEVYIYIAGTLKYRWFAVSVAWLICLVGWAIVMTLPNKYTSQAKVHVDSSTMLQPLLKDITVQQDSRMLVRIMKQLMFTTPNLEKIIQLSNLDWMVKNDVQRFELHQDMKKDIKITGGKRDGIFEISYESTDPDLAKNVVTAVLTVFSEQTQQSTLEDVSSSQRFIEQQIREYEVRLRNAEKAREAFKRENFGLLPEQGQGQMAKLQEATEQLEDAKLLLSQAISKRNVLAAQMQDVIASGDVWSSGDPTLKLSQEDEKITELRLKKTELLLKFTENHPAVKAIEITLKEAIGQKKQQQKNMKDSGLPSASAMANPYVQQLKIALNEAKGEVASNQTTVQALQERIKRHKSQFNTRLTVETEMQNLNRDYEIIRDNFQKLIQRREQASMSEKVDTETVSIKFKIADPPNRPLIPSGPKRLIFLTGVLVVGLGAGFGLAFLFFYINPSFMTIGQIREVTGLPVLGVVSKQMLDGSRDNKNVYKFIFILAGLFFVYLGLMGFEYLRGHQIDPFNLLHRIF